MNKDKYGIITEQGYPVGQGLGFNSVNEDCLKSESNNKDPENKNPLGREEKN